MSFGFPIRVYWEDTDAGGIVFYANYLKFFERARTEWLRHLGIEQQRLRQTTGGMFVVLATQVSYQSPAMLDDALWVSADLLKTGRASLEIKQVAYRRESNGALTPLCQGLIRIGWVMAEGLKPARIPPSLLEQLT